MLVSVSVVVPVYQGIPYIERMIHQIEACAEVTGAKTELLFVNDDPLTPIKIDIYSYTVDIRILNTEFNRGIHGARVHGLNEAKGEYVLFLDQDDRIFPLYLKSQLYRIKDGDAVVCRLVDGGKIYYDEQRLFQNAVDRNYVIGNGNTIVSPGQVLIRKNSISDIWKKNILHHNGADDWLLWLCMLSEGKQFVLNDDILFEHVMDGNNASLQTVKMIQSEQEVVEIVRKIKLLSDAEMSDLQQAFWKEVFGKIQLLDKFRNMVTLYDDWLKLENRGIKIWDILKKRGFHKVAIYGNGTIGKQIENSLKEAGISVCYFIDRSIPYLKPTIPIYTPKETLPGVDLVIISLVEHEEDVRKILSQKLNAKIWTIGEWIRGMHENG